MPTPIRNAHDRAIELYTLAEFQTGINSEGLIILAEHFDMLYKEIEELKSKPDQIEKIGIKWMKRADIYREGLKKVKNSYAVPSWVTSIVDNSLKDAEDIKI